MNADNKWKDEIKKASKFMALSAVIMLSTITVVATTAAAGATLKTAVALTVPAIGAIALFKTAETHLKKARECFYEDATETA